MFRIAITDDLILSIRVVGIHGLSFVAFAFAFLEAGVGVAV